MSTSPYLSQELKDYMKDFKVEETLSKIVNNLLRGKYTDPYAFMMNEFAKLAKNDITIIDLQPYQVINANALPSIKLQYKVEYKQKEYTIETPFQFGHPSDAVTPLYDGAPDVDGGKGVKNAIAFIKEKLVPSLIQKGVKDQKQIDELLQQAYETNGKTGINAIQSISYSLHQVQSQVEQIGRYQVLRGLVGTSEEPAESLRPKIIVNLLQGSKLVGVKCKLLDIVSSITTNIRKTICSGKLGEAALKFHTDGTYIVSVDTIADNIKMIEEAITKTPYKDQVCIGLNLMADNLFLADKKLYELENPKQLMDPVQMADYFLKLCTDKPIIKYIEDPIKSDDLDGWSKFKAKFVGKNVYIASSFLYSNADGIKNTSIHADADSHPDLTPAQRDEKNAKKFDLDCAHYRPFEFPTLSAFLDVAKLTVGKKQSTGVMIQDNFEEFTDTSLVDLAFALKNCWLNLASPFKLERLLKYNRIIEILALEELHNSSK